MGRKQVYQFYITYPKSFNLGNSLRNNLKLSFKPTYLPTVKKNIKTFIRAYASDCPEAEMDCISYIETAANKFNALIWRVDIKNRQDGYNHMTNDPALVCHLHDLSALSADLQQSAEFKSLVERIYEQDKKRGDKNRDMPLYDFCFLTMEKLKSDPLYKTEYKQFVITMSYGTGNNICFEDAINNDEKLISFIAEQAFEKFNNLSCKKQVSADRC